MSDAAENALNFQTVSDDEYGSQAIKTLKPWEHIRTRPGMYIGRIGNGEHHDDGIYVLLKEVIDNSVDEFVMGQGRRIEISISPEGLATVRDYGRGIPLDKLRECVSEINTGGKFITGKDGIKRPFSSSIGLNGVGLKAVNFLSREFTATSWRGGQAARVRFQEGVFAGEEKFASAEPNGTEICFLPSSEVFPPFHYDPKYLRRRMQHYSWLNSGLSIICNGERYFSRRGLLDLLEAKIESDPIYEIIHYKSERMEFAFCHTGNFNENYYSFVNTQYTSDGGTHLAAFKEAIGKAICELSNKDLEYDDIRGGITGAIAIKVQDPVFESQTKNKLGNTDIKAGIITEVKQAIIAYLYKNPETKGQIFDKIDKNRSVRKQIQAVRKGAKELAQKSMLKIAKLRDCKYHLNEAESRRKEDEKRKCEESMLFLTEGNSAAGSVVTARDPETQAVFSLRGKPLNCYGRRKETVYQNEELYGIMQALGIENSLDNLRYGKVVIATDADVD
ncbi:MAG: type IIA DNA topoisomerase subunit B, partial [Oligosphaeraceae bacterium]|nr:type IIA DNA topoisomerase subunit B [Oligosphaeraceae bacterium]